MGMKPQDLRKMMQRVQQMQQEMSAIQDELAEETFEASSGGGMVKAVVQGNGQLISVQIDPQVVDPQDSEMLGDLVVAAVNQALSAAQGAAGDRMGDLTAGLGLPPGLLG
ncbi:MAG: YbaB/EbfC family nucleoid-associated protein [Actinomycetota bacterium]|nr:YbaB/EbfC family nucleoid-associated protein [Actinomycetota bacterium]